MTPEGLQHNEPGDPELGGDLGRRLPFVGVCKPDAVMQQGWPIDPSCTALALVLPAGVPDVAACPEPANDSAECLGRDPEMSGRTGNPMLANELYGLAPLETA